MKKTSKYFGSALAVTSVFGATAATAAAQTNITFKIPAGPIDSIVDAFQRQTGFKIILSEPAIGTIQTPGVAGSMTIEKAVDALLFDLDQSIQQLGADVPEHPTVVQLTSVYHNLVRRWAEL